MPDDFLVVEPLVDDVRASTNGEHVLYRIMDIEKKQTGKCGNSQKIANIYDMIKEIEKLSGTLRFCIVNNEIADLNASLRVHSRVKT